MHAYGKHFFIIAAIKNSEAPALWEAASGVSEKIVI
jgi:hypothetical protein